MPNLKLILLCSVTAVIFTAGVGLGKHYEKYKQQKAIDAHELSLRKELSEAIQNRDTYRERASDLENKLKVKPKEVVRYVKKITENSDCANLGNNWRLMHNNVVEKFKNIEYSY